MKKLCTILTVLALVFLCSTLMPTEVQAAESGTCGTNLTWTLDNTGTLTISGSGAMEDYSYYAPGPWGNSRASIKAVVIGTNVTSIGDYAFYGCTNLISVTIANGVTSIGAGAFRSCTSLNSITLPGKVASIGAGAFRDCTNLASISIPDSVTSIGYYAFSGCSKLVYNTYDNAKYLGNANNPYVALISYTSQNITACKIHENTKLISNSAFLGCTWLTGIAIPNRVVSIDESAFSGCNGLISVSLGCSVTKIGNSAFNGCTGLTSITIPNSLIAIGNSAFNSCSNLTNVTYCGTAEQWGQISVGSANAAITNAQRNYHSWAGGDCGSTTTCTLCGATGGVGEHVLVNRICTVCKSYGICGDDLVWSFDGDATLTISGTGAMYDYRYGTMPWYIWRNSVQNVVIEDGVASIGDYAFAYLDLTSITIGTDVAAIASHAFGWNATLEKLYISDLAAWCSISFDYSSSGYDSNGGGIIADFYGNPLSYTDAFYVNGKRVTDLVIPVGVETISSYAFVNCDILTSVTIGNNVTTVGEHAFWYCDGITDVYIGEVVTSIGDYAFYDCKNLDSVTYCGTDVLWNQIRIGNGNTSLVNADRNFHCWVGGDCISLPTCAICGVNGGSYQHVWLEATCTSLQQCFICGVTTGDYVHTWTEATCSTLKTCTDCGATEGDYKEHTFDDDADHICNVCGYTRALKNDSLKFYGTAGLSFQDYIGMQALIKNSDVSDYDKVYVVAVQNTPNGDVTSIKEGIVYRTNYTIFEQQIVSWSMTEKVTMTLYAEKDGIVYQGQTLSASVEDLALAKLVTYSAQNNAKACAALVDMLNYGAAVQAAYNYNTDNLPNANLGKYAALGTMEDSIIDAQNDITGTGTVKVYAHSISLQDKVELQFVVRTSALKGGVVKATQGGNDVAVAYTESGSYTIICVAVAAAHMRDAYSVVVNDLSGNPVTSVYNVSVEAYAMTRLGGEYNNVVIAMMRYGDSVRALL